MIIGLTGGIACGKSTVSRMLAARGAHIIDADKIAREVVLPGKPALQQIVETFGSQCLHEDGTLNRKYLGSIVFHDEAARKKLEAITHPAIRQEMMRQIAYWEEADPQGLTVADIPLLYESGWDKRYAFSDIVVVYAPRSVQLERLMKRDGLSEEEAVARLNAQMPIEQKRKLADVVIDNSGSLEETERQVEQFVRSKREGLA